MPLNSTSLIRCLLSHFCQQRIGHRRIARSGDRGNAGNQRRGRKRPSPLCGDRPAQCGQIQFHQCAHGAESEHRHRYCRKRPATRCTRVTGNSTTTSYWWTPPASGKRPRCTRTSNSTPTCAVSDPSSTAMFCFLLIDAEQGFETQDLNVFHLAENNKGLVILVNKWDLLEKDTHSVKQFTQRIEEKIAPSMDIPILFVSALKKQRLLKALEEGLAVHERRKTRISTSKLNQELLPLIEAYPPPSVKGKYIKIKYITQLPTRYPQFVFFANLPPVREGSVQAFPRASVARAFRSERIARTDLHSEKVEELSCSYSLWPMIL